VRVEQTLNAAIRSLNFALPVLLVYRRQASRGRAKQAAPKRSLFRSVPGSTV
jgi:hypothetical protein